MTRSHNIIGCEAVPDLPGRRLAHFSHVHGAMSWGAPRRRRASTALAFAAGVAVTAIAVALLIARL